MEEERLSVGRPQAREAAHGVIERAVRVQDPRRGRCNPLVGREDFDEPLDRRGVDRGIRIEEEDEWVLAAAPADVARVRETAIRRKRNRVDRKVSDGLERAVGGGAVDDHHAHVIDGAEPLDARTNVVLAVVRDDDDVYTGHQQTVQQET